MVENAAKPGVGDARLAVHAASSRPAWLFAPDGMRVLWANPVGAQIFGARNAIALADRSFGPADAHRRQIAQLALRLPPEAAPRLERLRGFGAALGRFVTCACSHLILADGRPGILIVAAESVGRPMPLTERLQRLVQDAELPMAVFSRDGLFIGASQAARALAGFRSLSDAGLDTAREQALRDGRAETPVGVGQLVLQRVGSGADVGLVALLEWAALAGLQPQASQTGRPEEPAPATPEAPQEPEGTRAETLPQSAEPAALVAGPVAPEPEPTGEMPTRTEPLRFVWDDAGGHFAIRSDELLHLLGSQDAAHGESATPLGDAASRFAAAVATQAVWSGVSVRLPADGLSQGLEAELSGLPVFDANGFAGYRGFGICRDLAALSRLQALRDRASDHGHVPRSLSAQSAVAETSFEPLPEAPPAALLLQLPEATMAGGTPEPGQEDPARVPVQEGATNVVPLRPSSEPASPGLTPVESNAFAELARELSARLENDPAGAADHEGSPPEAAEEVVPDAAPAAEIAPAVAADLRPLLDAVSEAVLSVGVNGSIGFANRAASELFACDSETLQQATLADVLSQESAQRLMGRLPLSEETSNSIGLTTKAGRSVQATLVRIPGPETCLVLRQPAPDRANAGELDAARRDAVRALASKSETLSRISEELRAPLTAIIGLSDLLIAQRPAAPGDERYAESLKNIRGSGERLVAIVDDLLELATIESGQRDLRFTGQDLNELVETCVAAMQPQANRERIIIRSSLCHVLPAVIADGETLHQIIVNLLGNAIHLANPGGQVIVSTAHHDDHVILRVRDSGHGLNDNEMGATIIPLRSAETTAEPLAIRLSLTRALIEANRGRFSMKAVSYAGTLVEAAFPASTAG